MIERFQRLFLRMFLVVFLSLFEIVDKFDIVLHTVNMFMAFFILFYDRLIIALLLKGHSGSLYGRKAALYSVFHQYG